MEREINLGNHWEVEQIQSFLNSIGLKLPKDSDYTVGIFLNGELIGTGSLVGDVLQGIGIKPEFKGEGISSIIVTALIKKAFEKGKNHLFIFTKPENSPIFENMGFKKIAEGAPFASLMEWGIPGIDDFKTHLKEFSKNKSDNASCVVVNSNPFTLGHQYLIEKAARESDWLYVIVVEEDRSAFPFDIRFRLIKEGLKNADNIADNISVIPSGKYIISSVTFPSYFTQETHLAEAYASVDLEVFARHIAPSLKIKKRYVGSEPYCLITAIYNQYMKKLLTKSGIEVIEIPRLENNGEIISASTVRQLIKEKDMRRVKELVPPSTFNYLISSEAKKIIEKIR